MFNQGFSEEGSSTVIAFLKHCPLIQLIHVVVELFNVVLRPIVVFHHLPVALRYRREVLPLINVLLGLFYTIFLLTLGLMDFETGHPKLSAADITKKDLRFPWLLGFLGFYKLLGC